MTNEEIDENLSLLHLTSALGIEFAHLSVFLAGIATSCDLAHPMNLEERNRK